MSVKDSGEVSERARVQFRERQSQGSRASHIESSPDEVSDYPVSLRFARDGVLIDHTATQCLP